MTRAAVAELWERIEPILDTALELPPESWPAYLDNVCRGDTALRAAVERLLVSAGNTTSNAEGEVGAVAWAQPILVERELGVPSRIGPYVIDRVLGRGGMGSVYLARCENAELAPRVALKVMRNGLDQDRVLLRRFAEEREILATLEHPGIARLLEGGVTSEGHPWLAMEYIDGMPLDRYVESRALSLDDKLELFLQIVDAVSYAHRNLVVHRDLKPSNILVTADGSIKLLDFGIAKLLGPSDAGEAPITRTGFQPFTPEYASPEQVLGEPVSTSADVYALGVVLYELLTGMRPLNLTRQNPAEWPRLVRESRPKAPSLVVQDGEALRGDLDAIVLKALRRDPARRFASVDQLGDDVRRHLEERPVLARADSSMYRVTTFLRRRRAAVIVTAVVALGSATFGIFARSRNLPLTREPDRSAALRNHATVVTNTIRSALAELTDSVGRPLPVADLLDKAEPAISRQYATHPNVRAKMQSALGQLYLNNDDLTRAERLLRQAVSSQREYGHDSTDLASRLETLAGLLLRMQNYAGAESAGVEARGIRARLTPGDVNWEATAALGDALMGEEKYAEAEQIFGDLVAIQVQRPKVLPETPARILLGQSLERQGRNEEASSAFRQELEQLEAASEIDSGAVAAALSSFASAQGNMGHGAVADSVLRNADALYAAMQPIETRRIERGSVMASRAELAARAGDDGKAAPLADSARALWRGVLPPEDARWSTLARSEALMLGDRGQPEAAAARLTAMLDTLRSRPHPDLYSYRRTQATLANVFDRWGQPDSAAAHRALARPGAPLVAAQKR